MFVCPGKNVRNPIASMPGVAQQSVDTFLEECREVEQLGIPGIILFGMPEKKDARGTEAYAADGVVQRAVAHDGRSRRRDSQSARRCGLSGRYAQELRGKVLFRILWPVPRGGPARS